MKIVLVLLISMKNTLNLIIISLSILCTNNTLKAQDITLGQQSEIDNFASTYPGMTSLDNLTVVGDNITNLLGLNQLTSVREKLFLVNMENLTNLSGLNNIVTIGELNIGSVDDLNSIAALSNLTSLDHLVLNWNFNLEDIDALQNITTLKSISMTSMFRLENIDGLSNVSTISGSISLSGVTDLVNLNGFSNLITVGGGMNFNLNGNHRFIGLNNLVSVEGDIRINEEVLPTTSMFNSLETIGGDLMVNSALGLSSLNHKVHFPSLSSIQGEIEITNNETLKEVLFNNLTFANTSLLVENNLQLIKIEANNLTEIGSIENSNQSRIEILENSSLTDVSFSSLTNILGDLLIFNNENLLHLDGFSLLEEVRFSFDVIDNSNLVSIVSPIEKVGGRFNISHNNEMQDLAGFSNLQEIGSVFIEGNNALESLTGLDNVAAHIAGNLYIRENPNLTTCDVQIVCDFISTHGYDRHHIYNNNSGCNSAVEVADACGVILGADSLASEFLSIHPNPTDGIVKINGMTSGSYNLYNTSGHLVKNGVITQSVNFETLPSGLYFITLTNGRITQTEKLIIK